MDAHQIPEAIQWHEGLLLTPQHFQQLSLRHEALLQYVSAGLSPFGWGVRYFKVDQASLVGGTLRVLEVEAVMPDSLVVSYGARRGEELRVDLTPHADLMKQRPVAVHLAVPARETDTVTRWEWVPGQVVELDDVRVAPEVRAAVVYANYFSPGEHRAVLDPRRDVRLTLGESKLEVFQPKR